MTTSHRVDYPSRNGPQTVIRDMQTDNPEAAEQRAKELRAGGYEAVAYRVTIHEQGSAA